MEKYGKMRDVKRFYCFLLMFFLVLRGETSKRGRFGELSFKGFLWGSYLVRSLNPPKTSL